MIFNQHWSLPKIRMLKIMMSDFFFFESTNFAKGLEKKKRFWQNFLSLPRISSLGNFQFTCSFNKCTNVALKCQVYHCEEGSDSYRAYIPEAGAIRQFRSFLKDNFRGRKTMKKTKQHAMFKCARGGRREEMTH